MKVHNKLKLIAVLGLSSHSVFAQNSVLVGLEYERVKPVIVANNQPEHLVENNTPDGVKEKYSETKLSQVAPQATEETPVIVNEPKKIIPETITYSYTYKSGQIVPQIEDLIKKHFPDYVIEWRIDEYNSMFRGTHTVTSEDKWKLLDTILTAYNWVAEVPANNVLLISGEDK